MNSKMQAVLILPLSPIFKFSYSPLDWDESANISENFADDSRKKLKIDFRVNLKMEDEAVVKEKQVVHGDEEDETEEKEEEEFSFDCTNSGVPMVSAEEVFFNGKIRPMFPIMADGYDGRSPLMPPLKKLFIQRPDICPSSSMTTEPEDLNRAPQGPYCKWPGKLSVDASPEKCKKSNSTGFSKLRRFRELFHRSKRDGKDVFVFLNPPASGGSKKETETVNLKTSVVKKAKEPKGAKTKTVSSPNENYYLINRAKKDSDKRRSYLPYKLGFFANVNGMSRKVHPF